MIFYLLALWAVIHAALFLYSIFKVRYSGDKITFIYSWAFPIGAYCWEDLMVFSFFNLATALVSIYLQDLRIWLVIFAIFWVVRSAGEALYWFLQQFNQPTQYPHDQYGHFETIRKIFGNISNQKCFILLQILYQVVMVLAIAATIYLVANWATLPRW